MSNVWRNEGYYYRLLSIATVKTLLIKIVINVCRFSFKLPVIFVRFSSNLNSLDNFVYTPPPLPILNFKEPSFSMRMYRFLFKCPAIFVRLSPKLNFLQFLFFFKKPSIWNFKEPSFFFTLTADCICCHLNFLLFCLIFTKIKFSRHACFNPTPQYEISGSRVFPRGRPNVPIFI